MTRTQKIETFLFATILILGLTTITYAFFQADGSINTSDNLTATTSNGLKITLTDGANAGSITTGTLDPQNLKFDTYLMITNGGQTAEYARLMFKGITNTYSDDLVYTLEEINALPTEDVTPTVIRTYKNKVPVPKSSASSNQELAQGVLVGASTTNNYGEIISHTQYYHITIEYLYSDTKNQDVDKDASFYTGFGMENGNQVLTINYSVGEHGTELDSVEVTKGQTLSEFPVTQINKSNGTYISGWYLDSEYTTPATKDTVITDSITLYAKWETIPTKATDYLITTVYNIDQEGKNPENNGSGLYYHYVGLQNSPEDLSYRYVGGTNEANNYICFVENCTDANKWRIIGLFNDGNGYQIKIKIASHIGGNWNNSTSDGGNEWVNSSRPAGLNNGYLNGLTFKDKVDTNHEWSVRGVEWPNNSPTEMYKYEILAAKEEGATTYGGNPAIWTGGIALPYITDYQYSLPPNLWTTYSSSVRATPDTAWFISTDNKFEWLLTPHRSTNTKVATYLNTNGGVYGNYLVHGWYTISPAMYLLENVEFDLTVADADGSYAHPYIVKQV